MLNLLRFVALRHMRAKPARTCMTTLGIALGVALFSGVETINRSTLSSFKGNVEAVAGKATLTISGGEAGFPESTLEKVEAMAGVKQAVPMIETRAFFSRPDGQVESLMILGIDLLREQSVRTYKTEDQVIDDPLSFLNQPDSIILTRAFSQSHHLAQDTKFEIGTAYGRKFLTVRGLLSPTGPATAYGGGLAIMDIDGARLTFGKIGKLDRIDIVTAPNADVAQTRERIQAALGPAYEVQEPELQTEGLRRMVSAFQGMLTFLSSLALIVGVFLVSNSMSTAVAERRREIGTLRALGATRRSILASFLSEATLLGLVGSALGALLGRILAELLVNQVTRSMSGQFLTQIQIDHLEYGPRDVALALATGTLASIAAALWPAMRSMRIQPVEALRPKGVEVETPGSGFLQRYAPWIGAAALIYLYAGLRAGIGAKHPSMEAVHPLIGMIAAVLVAPVSVSKMIAMIEGRLTTRSPIIVRLSLGNLLRNPRRTGSNVLSLILGLVLVIIISSVNVSFRETATGWAAKALSFSDIVISANGRVVDFQVQPLHEEVAQAIEKVPGIRKIDGVGVRGFRFLRLQYQGKEIGLKAYDTPGGRGEQAYGFIQTLSDNLEGEGEAMFSTTERNVLVSESFKIHFGKGLGDTIELNTPSGPIGFKIAGVVRDYANPTGVIYINRTHYRKIWNDPLVTAFYVQAQNRDKVAELRRAIDISVGKDGHLITTLSSDLVTQLSTIIDQSFAFNQAIEAAALLVGLIGLLNTLLISVIERTRELGMLRAIGMSRKQLFSMILLESLIQGGFGALTAAAFGGYLSYLWVTSTLSNLLGWLIHFQFPLAGVFALILTGIGVALAAGYYPARRATQIQVREAIVYE